MLSRLILASNKHGNNTFSIFLSGHSLHFSHFNVSPASHSSVPTKQTRAQMTTQTLQKLYTQWKRVCACVCARVYVYSSVWRQQMNLQPRR